MTNTISHPANVPNDRETPHDVNKRSRVYDWMVWKFVKYIALRSLRLVKWIVICMAGFLGLLMIPFTVNISIFKMITDIL